MEVNRQPITLRLDHGTENTSAGSPNNRSVQVKLRLTPNDAQLLRRCAEHRDQTNSAFVRSLVRGYYAHLLAKPAR